MNMGPLNDHESGLIERVHPMSVRCNLVESRDCKVLYKMLCISFSDRRGMQKLGAMHAALWEL